MTNDNKLCPGCWVSIKYGEYAGSYGKVSLLRDDGRYMVLPYDKSGALCAMCDMEPEAIELIEPLALSYTQLKAFARAELTYDELKKDVFPAFNIKAKRHYKLKARDIADALENIEKQADILSSFKEWFWMILNVFYGDLCIEGRYDSSFFSDIPETDNEIFSVAYGLTEKLYWKLEERFGRMEEGEKYLIKIDGSPDWESAAQAPPKLEEDAFKVISRDVRGRVWSYEQNKGRPGEKRVFSDSQKRHIIGSYETDDDLKRAGTRAIEVYKGFVTDLYNAGDIDALKILAFGHYRGNAAFEQSWTLSEQYLLELFERTADPYAANSLGYIYYYGRTNHGIPEFYKSFRYFSFGLIAGIDESIYKVADMLMNGQGINRNLELAVELIINGYKDNLEHFCHGEYGCSFAEYSMRMGDICRKHMIYGMGIRDAYKFYLEADFAFSKRLSQGIKANDAAQAASVKISLRDIRNKLGLENNKNGLRADFPIYLSQIFSDRYPIKVSIDVPNGKKNGTLKVSRFRLGDELIEHGMLPDSEEIRGYMGAPPILVAYPELSWAGLVSEITYRLEDVTVAKQAEPGPYFLSDGFRRNDRTGALEFFAGGDLIAAIDAKWYVAEIKEDKR